MNVHFSPFCSDRNSGESIKGVWFYVNHITLGTWFIESKGNIPANVNHHVNDYTHNILYVCVHEKSLWARKFITLSANLELSLHKSMSERERDLDIIHQIMCNPPV